MNSPCGTCVLKDICKYKEPLETYITEHDDALKEFSKFGALKFECGRYPTPIRAFLSQN